ncbi:hypothetical protein JOF56_004875 [Kibdelosporangium banguiense]|uniref:Exo-alpha-sialidase n=1 Tax=Kibdelosporangium banguiense TaxID=1365924 RepID=A0ABS4TJ84_9PSEU|nr:hypothetical protein [Kibdelosporangium banguiense]MBP2324490.1 hypothetical protein [Kibdelosporangium banguiense]
MRDLDSELTGLRRQLHDSVRQPATKDMIKRGRRRTRRQQAQVTAVIAVIVALGMWPFLQAPESAAPAVPNRSHMLSYDYFEIGSGFALGRVCVPSEQQCDPWFMSTSDGQNWVKRTVPPVEVADNGNFDRVIALGNSSVVIEDYRVSSADRYFSKDSGRTWVPVQVRPDTTIQQIPPDAVLETMAIPPNLGQCRDGAVIAMLGESGQSAKLANQPPIELTWCQPYPDANGARWVAGSDPRTRQPVVASTRDRGLTWQVTPLPPFTPPPASKITSYYPKVTVVSTSTASYATVTNPEKSELVAIFRSTDHGVSWTRTWEASEGKQPARVLGTPVAGADGSLWITQPGEVWVSTDGAKSFTLQTPRTTPPNGTIDWTRAGYLSTSADSGTTGQFFLSSDGITWHPVRIPVPE